MCSQIINISSKNLQIYKYKNFLNPSVFITTGNVLVPMQIQEFSGIFQESANAEFRIFRISLRIIRQCSQLSSSSASANFPISAVKICLARAYIIAYVYIYIYIHTVILYSSVNSPEGLFTSRLIN